MRCYLAARYSRHEELSGYAAQLEKIGHTVTSRWINGEHDAFDRAKKAIDIACDKEVP